MWLFSYLDATQTHERPRWEAEQRSLPWGLMADAQNFEHPWGCSPLPDTNSPGLDDPSLIRMGLAKFTRIVLPKSSDSFCRGEKHNKAHQRV